MLRALTVSLLLLAFSEPAWAGKARLVFVHDRGAMPGVFAMHMDGDGVLEAIPGAFPLALPGGGNSKAGHYQTLAHDSGRRLLFAGGKDGIDVLRIADDGALAVVAGSPFGPAGGGADSDMVGLAVVKKGKSTYVIALENAHDTIRSFALAADDTLVDVGTAALVLDPDLTGIAVRGNAVFALARGTGAIHAFTLQGDGMLVADPDSPYLLPPGADPTSLHVDASGRYLHAVGSGGTVFGFKIAKKGAALGALAPLDTGLDGAGTLALGTRTVAFAFRDAADPDDGDIVPLDLAKGAVRFLPMRSGVDRVRSVAYDLGARRLVVASDDDGKLCAYDVDVKRGTLGHLSQLDAMPNGAFCDVEIVLP